VSPRDRRALLSGGAVLLGAVLLFRVFPASIRKVQALHATTIERVAMAAEARDVLEAAPALHDTLTRTLAEFVALAPQLVDGGTVAEAGANLSALVSLASSRHGVRIVRMDPVPDSADGIFRPVAVHVEAEADVAGLTRLIRAVETGLPVLSLQALTVQSPEPAARSDAPERLHLEATIVGWYLPKRVGGS
jgi:type II secretion system (T2SS) protein M